MDYMLDKINLLENKDNIIKVADDIYKLLMENPNLDDSEKLMTIELAVAKVNYNLYKMDKIEK